MVADGKKELNCNRFYARMTRSHAHTHQQSLAPVCHMATPVRKPSAISNQTAAVEGVSDGVTAWAKHFLHENGRVTVAKLTAKANPFVPADDSPDAHRTSNMVDRHMQRVKRNPALAGYTSSVHKLNGKVYPENWLENLLIATSRSAFLANPKTRTT